jgi:hypothetical protein
MKAIHESRQRGNGAPDAVVAWRREQLRASGFDAALAQALAAELGVDLHALIELVERGCPPPLAARILAPLDDPPVRTPVLPTLTPQANEKETTNVR